MSCVKSDPPGTFGDSFFSSGFVSCYLSFRCLSFEFFSATGNEVRCPRQIHFLKNGIIDGPDQDYYYPDQGLWYICNKGYVLKGVQDVFCLENGQWDHPAPTCERKYITRWYGCFYRNMLYLAHEFQVICFCVF